MMPVEGSSLFEHLNINFILKQKEAEKNGSEDWKFWDDMEDYRKVTPEQAAKAIRNYLKDGNSDWRSVMQQKEMGV